MDNHGNFNRLLTRDFTLVWARMAGRSNPQNEVEISLITQRSQVQILSRYNETPSQGPMLVRCNRALIIFVSHPLANVAVYCAIDVRDNAELVLDAGAVSQGVGAAHRTRIRRFGWTVAR
jgi:hypothetical protein